jgi:nitrous oxide reductase accessory protein NosL
MTAARTSTRRRGAVVVRRGAPAARPAGPVAPAAALALSALLAFAPGCGKRSGPPAILEGASCWTCGMGVRDKHFASERRLENRWRVYDSIECLVKDAAAAPGGTPYLPDYDTARLHPADSLWIVRGDFSSPMGGGLAAFLHRASADTVAVQTNGTVMRFADLVPGRTP